jgi:ABC-2 type transport system permease protein
MYATWTLFLKEIRRFWKVGVQTVAAPVMTAFLYLLIFGHALSGRAPSLGGVEYTAFLVPGLIMMSVLQNAFANASSSLIQSKVMGNMIFLLLTPLRPAQIFIAYVGAAIVRGVAVGLGVLLCTVWFVNMGGISHVVWMLVFLFLGAALLGALGLLAGIWAEKFDQLATFQNFIIMPATFLSGVFYSIHSLPNFWQKATHLNPFFYMIDGFRYGFFGVSDVSPWLSVSVVLLAMVVVSGIAMVLLARGYKMRT